MLHLKLLQLRRKFRSLDFFVAGVQRSLMQMRHSLKTQPVALQRPRPLQPRIQHIQTDHCAAQHRQMPKHRLHAAAIRNIPHQDGRHIRAQQRNTHAQRNSRQIQKRKYRRQPEQFL